MFQPLIWLLPLLVTAISIWKLLPQKLLPVTAQLTLPPPPLEPDELLLEELEELLLDDELELLLEDDELLLEDEELLELDEELELLDEELPLELPEITKCCAETGGTV